MNMKDTISKEQVDSVLDILKSMSDEDVDTIAALTQLLELSDEDFVLVAPGVLHSFELTLNSPNVRLSLAQSANANGVYSEDLLTSFRESQKAINEIDGISQIKRDFLTNVLGIIINAVESVEGIAKRFVSIPVELCHPKAKMPQYANASDSGMDVYALEDYTIGPGETLLVPTGIKMAIPAGYEIQVRPKSGRALKTKLRVANTPGTVDAGYRDEIKVIIENVESPIKDIGYDFDENGKPVINSILHGSAYHIGEGEKFCQLVLMEVPKAALYRVESVGEIGENRGGGFGSSGLV